MLNLRQVKRSRRFFANWQKLGSLLVLADESHLPELEGFIEKAEKEQKTATAVFIYKGKPGQAPAFRHSHVALPKKELTVLGLPKEDAISVLNSKKADVLISLGGPGDLSLLALAKLSDVPCKIGRFEHAAFDISIASATPIGTKAFLEQAYTYLNMIKNE